MLTSSLWLIASVVLTLGGASGAVDDEPKRLTEPELLQKHIAWAAERCERLGAEQIAQFIQHKRRIALGEDGPLAGKKLEGGFQEIKQGKRTVIQWESRKTRDAMLALSRQAMEHLETQFKRLEKGEPLPELLTPRHFKTGEWGLLHAGQGALLMRETLAPGRLLLEHSFDGQFKTRDELFFVAEGFDSSKWTAGKPVQLGDTTIVFVESTTAPPTSIGGEARLFVVRALPAVSEELKKAAGERGAAFAVRRDAALKQADEELVKAGWSPNKPKSPARKK